MFTPAVGSSLLIALLLQFLPLTRSLPHSARDLIAPGTKLRILPLGNSITFGDQPDHQGGTNGYRLELSNRLSGSDFDFVGTLRSGNMSDPDNEGHSGFTISQISNVMGPALDLQPNVVLLHAGTNDLNREETNEEPYKDAPMRLGNLIDAVLSKCPNAVVLVAKIIQIENAESNERVATFNNAVPEVVKQRFDKGSKVLVVDHSVVGKEELADGVHPTDAGYAHMGDIWFEGIKYAADNGLITSPEMRRE